MTCIVGWANKSEMIMGGDSAAIADGEITIRRDPKVFSLKQPEGPEVLIGFAGSFRMVQLLMTMKIPKDPYEGRNNFHFMIEKFIPVIQNILKHGGHTIITDHNEAIAGEFLVGYRGQIFRVQSDFQVEASLDSYHSIGSGHYFALGVLDALTLAGERDPEKLIKTALEVAQHRSASVRGPFNILKVDLNKLRRIKQKIAT